MHLTGRLLSALCVIAITFSEVSSQPNILPAVALDWGDYVPAPRFGYNARVSNDNWLDGCQLPEPADLPRDWRGATFRSHVANLKPQILRFPAGNAGNYWFWETETRTVVGDNGLPRQLTICEGSFLDNPENKIIGCEGPLFNFTADKFELAARKSITTLSGFIEAMDHFQNELGMDVEPMYMLGPMDPFYFVGSPQLEYETQGWTAAQKRQRIGERAYLRMMKQLNALLKAYCGDCTSYDGVMDIEIGCELYLFRYGKWMPGENCFNMAQEDLCDNCRTDIFFYADLCDAIIPQIRSKFPNAQIGVVGGRINANFKPWTPTLINRFGPQSANPVEGIVVHFYPRPVEESKITPAVCLGNLNSINIDDVLHRQFYVMKGLFNSRGCSLMSGTDWPVWPTEFNSLDMTDICSGLASDSEFSDNAPLFYQDSWIHTLNILGQFNSFMAYQVPQPDPWLGASGNVKMDKVLMHSLYGNATLSAMLNNGTLTGAGIATTSILELLGDANELKRLIIAPPANANITQPGQWTPNVAPGVVLPYHYIYTDTEVSPPVQEAVFDVYGWIFKGDNTYKALLVNHRNKGFNLSMAAVPGFTFGYNGITHTVPPDSLARRITAGLDTPYVISNELYSANGTMYLPPYSFAIVEGMLPGFDPCADGVMGEGETGIDCGGTLCAPCACNPFLVNSENFDASMGIWQTAGLGASRIPTFSGIPSEAGSHFIRFAGPNAFLRPTSPMDATAVSKARITFDYGSLLMNAATDGIAVQVSLDAGANFTTIKSYNFGTDFQNAFPNVADVTYNGPFSNQFLIRVRSRAGSVEKTFYLDNVKLYACSNQGSGSPQPLAPPSLAGSGGKSADSFALNLDEPRMDIYPVPVSDLLNINLSGIEPQELNYTVFNTAGMAVISGKEQYMGPESLTSIPIQHTLSAGVYTLRMQHAKGVLTRRFVVLHR